MFLSNALRPGDMVTIGRGRDDVDYWLKREAEERAAERRASNVFAREAHFRMAERYADLAWSLAETLDGPPVASGLWIARPATPRPVPIAANDDIVDTPPPEDFAIASK